MLNTCVTIGYCPRVMFNAKNSMHAAAGKTKLDGCMLNEHNTVFASNRSAICNRCFPVPTRVLDEKLQTASPSLQPFLPGSLGDRPTNRLTDHATWSIKIGGAHSREAKFCYCLRLQQIFIGAVDSTYRINFSNQQLYSAV